MIVLGIDGSLTCTGFAVITTDGVPGSERIIYTERMHTSPEDGTDVYRARNLAARALGLAKEYDAELIGLEMPYVDQRKAGDVGLRLARLGGAFEQALEGGGFEVVQVAAASAGKALGIKGRNTLRAEKKRQAIANVRTRYGLTVTDDEADAIGVALAAVVTQRKSTHGKQSRMKLPAQRRGKEASSDE